MLSVLSLWRSSQSAAAKRGRRCRRCSLRRRRSTALPRGARRTQVRFTFVLPTRNQDGSEPIEPRTCRDLRGDSRGGRGRPDQPGASRSAESRRIDRREASTAEGRGGTGKEGGRPRRKKDDPRPGPGETVTFVEELTEARLKPTYTTPVPAPKAPDPAAAPTAAPAAPAAPAAFPLPRRIYVIRGVARGGRPGAPTTRIELPIADPPPPPGAVDGDIHRISCQALLDCAGRGSGGESRADVQRLPAGRSDAR